MSRAFTLVELMIVVAIIAVLTAIAIPAIASMQYRAKRAELPTIIDGLQVAHKTYLLSHDTVLNFGGVPAGALGKNQKLWVNNAYLEPLAFEPDGYVRGMYRTDLPNGDLCKWSEGGTVTVLACSGQDFCVYGLTDVDADGDQACMGATEVSNPTLYSSEFVY